MVFWTISVIAIVYGLKWLVLYVTDVTDPKGRKQKVLKPGEKPGRWDGRTLDRVWFVYYLLHIPITLGLDAQSVFPPAIIPTALHNLNEWYKAWSRDPIINNAGTGSRQWAWLDVFLHAEVGVQVPCFVLGAWWLWKNDKRAYPLTLLYAAHTATTLLPVLYYILTHNKHLSTLPAPVKSSIFAKTPVLGDHLAAPLTEFEIVSLLASYVPFLLIPVGMMLDMVHKLNGLMKVAERVKVLERAEAVEVEDIRVKKRK